MGSFAWQSGGMTLPRALLLAAATTLAASLEAISFDFTFSDVGATQTLTGTIDVSAVSSQYGAYWQSGIVSQRYFEIQNFTMTLAGAPTANGVYGLSSVQSLYMTIPADLNLTTELVGQYSVSQGLTFGGGVLSPYAMFLVFTGVLDPSGARLLYYQNYTTVRLRGGAWLFGAGHGVDFAAPFRTHHHLHDD